MIKESSLFKLIPRPIKERSFPDQLVLRNNKKLWGADEICALKVQGSRDSRVLRIRQRDLLQS